MPIEKADQSFCYQWGRFGQFLTWVYMAQPILLWASFTARAFVGSRAQLTYYRIQTASALLTWMLYYVLRDGVFRSPAPHPFCNSNRFSRPGFEVAMMSHLFVAVLLRDKYFGWPYGAWNWLWFVLVWVIVYGGACASANYGQVDLLIGVAYGATMGLLGGYVIYTLLVPLLPLLYPFWWFWWDWQGGLRSSTLLALDDYASYRDQIRQAEERAQEWS